MRLLKRFRLNSIRRKLFLLVILNGSVALLLVGLLLFGYEKVETRQAAEREFSSQAGIVAASSAASLTFQDERDATQTLTALRADAAIEQAAIYTADGRLFAWYERGDPEAGHLPRRLPGTGVWSTGDYLMVSRQVRLGTQSLGTVYLKASMREADRQLSRDMGFVSLALLVSLALSLLMTASMQRTITRPVAELSNVARLVSIGKDYSARAVRRAEDEIGFLVDSFNDMLSQIQLREQALRESEESAMHSPHVGRTTAFGTGSWRQMKSIFRRAGTRCWGTRKQNRGRSLNPGLTGYTKTIWTASKRR